MTNEYTIKVLKSYIKDAIWAIDTGDLEWARKVLAQANNILNKAEYNENT